MIIYVASAGFWVHDVMTKKNVAIAVRGIMNSTAIRYFLETSQPKPTMTPGIITKKKYSTIVNKRFGKAVNSLKCKAMIRPMIPKIIQTPNVNSAVS